MNRSIEDIKDIAKTSGIYSETFGPDREFKFEEIGGDAWESLAGYLVNRYILNRKGPQVRRSKSSAFPGFMVTVYDNGYMMRYYIY